MISLRAADQLNRFISAIQETTGEKTSLLNIVQSYPTAKYYLFYGLINRHTSEISELGKKLLSLISGNDYIALIDVISNILLFNPSYNGYWTEALKHKNDAEDCYKFEANSSNDASFCYALFLFELDLLVNEPNFSQSDSEGYFSIRFSQLGLDVQRRILGQYNSRIIEAQGKIKEGASPNVTVDVNFAITDNRENSGTIFNNEGPAVANNITKKGFL